MIIQLVIVLGQPAPTDGAERIHAIIEDAGLGEWKAEVDLAGVERQVWFDAKVRPGHDPGVALVPKWQALLDTRGVGDWAKVSLPKKTFKDLRGAGQRGDKSVTIHLAKAPALSKRTVILPAHARWAPVPIPSDYYRFDLFAFPNGDLLGCEGGACWRTHKGDVWEKDPALRAVRAVAGSPTDFWAAGNVLQRSADGGKSWERVATPTPDKFRDPQVTALAVKGQEVVVGISENGATYDDEEAYQFFLYRSVDGGRTFSRLHQSGSEIRSVLLFGDEILFANNEVLRWQRDGSVTIVAGIAATQLAQHAGVIFAAGAADLYLSRDGGRSFEKARSTVSARSETGDAISGKAYGFGHFFETGHDLYAASSLGALRVSSDGVEPVAWGLHDAVDGVALAHGFLYAHSGRKLWRTVVSSR